MGRIDLLKDQTKHEPNAPVQLVGPVIAGGFPPDRVDERYRSRCCPWRFSYGMEFCGCVGSPSDMRVVQFQHVPQDHVDRQVLGHEICTVALA